MPFYDAQCSSCHTENSVQIKISELSTWDLQATCPHCGANAGAYRRIIKSAPASSVQKGFRLPKRTLSSGDKDEMRHKGLKHRNSDQVAEAREAVAKGTYEGF